MAWGVVVASPIQLDLTLAISISLAHSLSVFWPHLSSKCCASRPPLLGQAIDFCVGFRQH